MTRQTQFPEAVIVMPDAGQGLVRDPIQRRWLSRSNLSREPVTVSLLDRVRRATGQPDAGGPAALRIWGQTGDRPGTWLAAADPVYLEPGLRRMRLHRLRAEELPSSDLRQLFDELESVLGGDAAGFTCLGRGGYLRSHVALPTPPLSPEALDGLEPEEFLPRGGEAATYMKLLSEIQMTLHGSDVARRREAEGRRPINSLWIWGGGTAPEVRARPIAPLFSSDPMLRGLWLSADAVTKDWPGTISACADLAPQGFVAEVPDRRVGEDAHVGRLAELLSETRRLLRDGALRRLTLLFRDGLTARVEGRHGWRVWRSDSALLGRREPDA
ncbi:MAG: hypothetical protein OEW35_00170 [Gammaproteobacteria bacterium]|nr:hypothetical protein [Gammaproteobacteria bacterium]MDH4252917.1 hypothetical protein [Gammaproteobacteria bacterium]MDH5308397.1 hypothetical protein [Gammaproteobacteria bacterium]